MKKTLICIDRDGTLIYDSKDHLFLGKDDEWESKVKILPFVGGCGAALLFTRLIQPLMLDKQKNLDSRNKCN